MPKILIIAGENSGDLHGANLIKAIKILRNDIEFSGIGGKRMQAEGLDSLADISNTSVVGFWEVAKKYGFFRNLLSQIYKIIDEEKIDLFIPIDYPGFNLRVAKYAKTKKIKVIYYIAPQLWAWGAKRANELANSINKLLVVFPFEVDFFERYGISTHFVGHPLMDIDEFKSNKIIERKKQILMMPGSRLQEIKRHLKLLVDTKYFLEQELNDWQFVFPHSNSIDMNTFSLAIDNGIYPTDNSIGAMLESRIGIIKSGTSNLESALSGLPFTMFYKTSPISYLIAKRLVKLEYLSIVNILAKKRIVNELIQKDATPEKIAKATMELLNSEQKNNIMSSEFLEIKNLIGGRGASERAARIVIGELLSN